MVGYIGLGKVEAQTIKDSVGSLKPKEFPSTKHRAGVGSSGFWRSWIGQYR